MMRGQQARDKDGLFTIKVLLRRPDAESRAAVVISRKTAKSAVQRNRMRRRIFEILRQNWGHLPAHADIVVIVHDASLRELSHDDLRKRLAVTTEAAFVKVGRPKQHGA